MLAQPDIRLAAPAEASAIATMSRDFIEHGLHWSWTTDRVLAALRDPATNVAVILQRDQLRGFGIMHYGDDSAHLALLAIAPAQRHQRLGAQLMAWLEHSARIAGLATLRLEARADNLSALAFYQRLGYVQTARVSGYYEGRVDAVRLQKSLSATSG